MVWRRRRRDWDEEWDIFDEFFRFGIDDIFERMMRDIEEIFRKAESGEIKPIVRGFSIRIGPDGKPEIREFGTKPTIKETGIEERRPLVDVIETDNEIQVIAEMPGVNKDDIELNATETTLEIRAEGENRKYYETVELPAEVDPDSAKARYNNGVLEVILKKKTPKTSGKKIKIE
ncbi:archaeal heat shock protein Hsp20 [Archaeoglobus fulgidus]|jgi:HSP20 family protein|uniref:Small heat shock protein (Hsp20-1) n=3 Tax=Archaeoglobus fulgidus TaxID=2234 RepID=O28973_ARCFU|nr:archaeal heat shock protein Hsp20 [Archaeoglobus fulgidus]AAB89949.1 small heat shock protein (hsp20-1) [Archaeoglobus fulgidus DSM 4304]AIG98176.1 Molecular chaperone (small heat shock protein) [Archaeoglobus fulgidus DSM 8774]KUJ93064.1 MAG: Small heat shock protein (Hsp20-1) [Archaeoglobus fulgidus]KUK06185.1 MAG: Small heat shock protein (Hsp20-1) [Archaeoglobus fulgidus]